jgi:hypothetical protein
MLRSIWTNSCAENLALLVFVIYIGGAPLKPGRCWLCDCRVVLGRFAKNRKKASPILLLPRERLELIRTRFPVQRFAKTAKKTHTETKAAQRAKLVKDNIFCWYTRDRHSIRTSFVAYKKHLHLFESFFYYLRAIFFNTKTRRFRRVFTNLGKGIVADSESIPLTFESSVLALPRKCPKESSLCESIPRIVPTLLQSPVETRSDWAGSLLKSF